MRKSIHTNEIATHNNLQTCYHIHFSHNFYLNHMLHFYFSQCLQSDFLGVSLFLSFRKISFSMLTMGDSNASDAKTATATDITKFPIKSRKNNISLKNGGDFIEASDVTNTIGWTKYMANESRLMGCHAWWDKNRLTRLVELWTQAKMM